MSGKRPTRQQKKLLKLHGLNPDNWLVVKNPVGQLYIEHRHTGTGKVLKVS